MRTTCVLGLSEGVTLKAWSLESFIPPPNACPGSHVDRGCYFIFQTRGFGDGTFNFWVETQVRLWTRAMLKINFTMCHTLDIKNIISVF